MENILQRGREGPEVFFFFLLVVENENSFSEIEEIITIS